jgi:hypothetical protein
MPWMVVEINGQQELIYFARRESPRVEGDGFVHLPQFVPDDALIDPPANLNVWLSEQLMANEIEKAENVAVDRVREIARVVTGSQPPSTTTTTNGTEVTAPFTDSQETLRRPPRQRRQSDQSAPPPDNRPPI